VWLVVGGGVDDGHELDYFYVLSNGVEAQVVGIARENPPPQACELGVLALKARSEFGLLGERVEGGFDGVDEARAASGSLPECSRRGPGAAGRRPVAA